MSFWPMANILSSESKKYEEIVWKNLLNWRNQKPSYPTIAGTIPPTLLDGAKSFEDVGLLPNHTVSILDVKEIQNIDKKTQYKYSIAY